MYAKLAIRNVRRSFKDYAIYFITLMLFTKRLVWKKGKLPQ